MTQLFINGQEAVLPEDLSLTISRSNPYFDRNGSFSFEFSLSLLAKQNLDIFGHVNRHDAETKKISYPAEMIVSGNAIIGGKVIVTGITNTQISVQLKSDGSSSVIDSFYEQYIDEMNIGRVLNYDQVLDEFGEYDGQDIWHQTKPLPSNVFSLGDIKRYTWGWMDLSRICYGDGNRTWTEITLDGQTTEDPGIYFMPLWNEAREVLVNWAKVGREGGRFWPLSCDAPEHWAPQLRVKTALKLIFESMGFRINSMPTIYENLLFHQAVINNWVQPINGELRYALPHMTLSKFLEGVEQMFCVNFYFNADKTIDIIDRLAYTESNANVVMALDDLSTKISNESQSSDSSLSNLKYSWKPGDDYKLMRIDTQLYPFINFLDFDTLQDARDWAIDHESELSYTITKISEDMTWRMWSISGQSAVPTEVNQFRDLIRNEDGKTEEMIFKPIRLEKVTGIPFYKNVSEFQYADLDIIVSEANAYDEHLAQPTIQDLIDDGAPVKPEHDACEIFLMELEPVNAPRSWNGIYYQSYTDNARLCLYSLFAEDTVGGVIESQHKIDTTISYDKKFVSNDIPDIQKPFMIRGQLYIASEIRTTITKYGIDPIQEGTFYRI